MKKVKSVEVLIGLISVLMMLIGIYLISQWAASEDQIEADIEANRGVLMFGFGLVALAIRCVPSKPDAAEEKRPASMTFVDSIRVLIGIISVFMVLIGGVSALITMSDLEDDARVICQGLTSIFLCGFGLMALAVGCISRISGAPENKQTQETSSAKSAMGDNEK